MTPLYAVRASSGDAPRIAFINHEGDIELEVGGDAGFGSMKDRALVRVAGALRLIDRRGTVLAQVDGVRAEAFSGDVARYAVLKESDFQWGLLGRDGDIVVKPHLWEIGPVCENHYCARVRATDLFSFFSVRVGEVLRDVALNTTRLSEGLLGSCDPRNPGALGYRALSGAWVCPPHYETTAPFSAGTGAVVKRVKRKLVPFFIDARGNERMELKAFEAFAGEFSDDVIGVYGPKESGFVDASGRVLFTGRFESLGQMVNGAAAAKAGDLWGLIGRDGKWRVSPRFAAFERQEAGFFVFARERSPLAPRVILNKEGRQLWPRESHGSRG